MVLYFSGTGNSRFAAKLLAYALRDECVDAFPYLQAGSSPVLTSKTPWVIVCPTHAWRIPPIFREFLLRSSFAGSEQAYFVMTCGSEIGNAAAGNREICEELGLVYMGTAEIVMPENYLAMFAVPGEAESQDILRESVKSLLIHGKRIRDRQPLEEAVPKLADRVKSGVVNNVFNRLFVSDRNFFTTDKCVACTKCVQSCPNNNIRLDGGRPIWGGDCCHCMACITSCPQEAIEYGKKTAGKRRYRCPEFTLEHK